MGTLHDARTTILKERPFWLEGLEPLSSAGVEAYVLRHAGARPRERDAIDQRIVDDVRARKGRIIDSQEAVGGYPEVEPVRRPLQVPAAKDVEAWLERLAAEVE